jgi:vacuolar-type H+-ATPase subunit H
MKQALITQVRATEENAERLVQEAHAEADRILRDARRRAADQRQMLLERAKHHAKERFEQGAQAVEPDLAAIRQQAADDIAAAARQADARQAAAVEDVVTRFHQQFGMDA